MLPTCAKLLLALPHGVVSCLRRCLLTGLGVLLSWCAHAQLEASQWYFGRQAGLDFRAGEPVALTNGALDSDEGCSSRADSLGNLLFYTNGVTVWNRQHQVMAGGASLRGNTSTTQCLVVAQPGSRSVYYLFSPDEVSQGAGFRYSVVEMDRQGGLGEVVRRDVLLHPTSTERVAAVPHANGRDLWVIGHERDTDVCFVYLLTAQGVVSLPVLSRDGFVHQRVQAIGQLKASPNGRRLALAAGTVNPQQTQGIPSVELLDFDPATGRISNPVVLPPARIASYGVEFSPDGTRLYVTDPFFGALFQYDLTAANIGASVVPIPVAPGQAGSTPSALQLGPDGRIYVALTNTTVQAVSVITEPNSLGTACAYINQGVSLNGRRSALGLPSYVQRDLWHFTLKGKCQNSPIAFAFPASYAPDSVRWDFGDPASGPRNLSSLLAPTHTYSAPGRYLVSLTLSLPGGYISTLRRYVDVFPLPQVNIGRDTSLCPGSRLTLNATTVGATYRWQDGSTTATITTDRTGWYWVDVTSAAGCTTRDSLRIRAAPVPRVRLGADTVLCVGTSVMLQPRLVELGTRYRWQNGVTTSALIVNQPGIYWVEGTNGAGCSTRDSVRVFYLDPPTVYLGRDTTLCSTPEQPFMLDATLPGVRYRWQDGSTGATFTPDRSGRYWVRVSTDFCSATDTILVRLYECRQSVFVPNIITPNGDGKNDALQVTGLGTVPWSLVIYNRWGKQVYETSNYQQNWSADGLADGTYFYLLRHAQSTQQVKGWVEVLR